MALVFRGIQKKAPMRGGAALAGENTTLWNILLIAAYIDFVHDFNDSSRTSISVELLKGDPYGVVPPKDKFKGIEDLLAKGGGRTATAFHAFKGIVSRILLKQLEGLLPPQADESNRAKLAAMVASIRKEDILHETDILNLIGVDYARFITSLPRDILPPAAIPDPNIYPVFNGSVAGAGETNVGGIKYTVSSYPTKLRGENKAYVHTAEAFHGVTGKARNVFVCMIDAASCSMDIIGDPWTFTPAQQVKGNTNHLSYLGQPYNSSQSYHFFILNSKENISDPAGKSTIRNRVLPLKVDPEQKNVFVYFLEEADPNHVSVFPIGTEDTEDPVQKANQSVFTPFTVDTRRTGTVEAPIVSAVMRTPEVTFTMNDVGTDSEVRSATQRAVTQTLLKCPDEEVFSNFMMKRFGDWCQALCLKDTKRRYRVVGINKSSKEPTSKPLYNENDVVCLNDLQTIHKALIFLLTIDRVLLAFALALGINVIFTSKSGVIGTSWMTLFQTGVEEDNVSDAAELYAKLGNLDQMIRAQGVFVQSVINSVEQLQVPIVNMQFDKYAVSLLALRNTLSILSFLPTIPTLEKHLIKVTEDHEENPQFSFLVEFGEFTVDAAGTQFGSIPSDIAAVPEADRNRYQKSVNEFRSFVETVEKNQALIARYAAGQPPRSAEQVKEDEKVDMFFKTLAANPTIVSSRHPLFKSVEQTLQSIISNARLTGIKLTPLGDVSAAWDAAAVREGRDTQFVPRQSGRAAAAAPLPLKELFSAYQIASQSAAAAMQGGQRGGGLIKDVLESPLTEMVYVIYLPKPVLQIDDLEGVANVRELSLAKYAEASQLLQQLVEARTTAGDKSAAETLLTTENLKELTAELMSEFVHTGVYGGKIGNDQGHLASVIDPYVFFGGQYLKEFLLEDPPPPVDPARGVQLVYIALRYILWKTDELYTAVEKLKSANPENDADLTAYDALVDELNALELLIDRQMVGPELGMGEVAKPLDELLGTFVHDVQSFMIDSENDEDEGRAKGDSDIRGELEKLAPFADIRTIDSYMANFPDENPFRRTWITQAKPVLSNIIDTAAKDAATGSSRQLELTTQYFNTLEEFVKLVVENGAPTFADDLRLYVRTNTFKDLIEREDTGLVANLVRIREEVYRAYEYIDTKLPGYPFHRIAYPSINFGGGGGRRKTHRRRGLPKLI